MQESGRTSPENKRRAVAPVGERRVILDLVVHAHRFVLESPVTNFGAWIMPTSKDSRIVERFTCAENRNRFWNRDVATFDLGIETHRIDAVPVFTNSIWARRGGRPAFCAE